MSGAVSYQNGLAAEDQVQRHYAQRGAEIAARRWRGKGGEIDLIVRQAGVVVFVEVKASATLAGAAAALGQVQQGRLYTAAAEFLATEPGGLDSEARFDVALVDQAGRIEIVENAFGQ